MVGLGLIPEPRFSLYRANGVLIHAAFSAGARVVGTGRGRRGFTTTLPPKRNTSSVSAWNRCQHRPRASSPAWPFAHEQVAVSAVSVVRFSTRTVYACSPVLLGTV